MRLRVPFQDSGHINIAHEVLVILCLSMIVACSTGCTPTKGSGDALTKQIEESPSVPNLLKGVWWKDCELDTRYDHAWGTEMAFGKPNPVGAWKLLEITKLAKSGDACMQYMVGGYYNPQLGVWTDVPSAVDSLDFSTRMREAAKWFRLAAEQGHGGAQELLAGLYWSGDGVRQDYVEAAKWFKEAADQGLSCSQLQLGLMYQDSEGFTKDYVYAYNWINMASANELSFGADCSEMARGKRTILAVQMTPDQISNAQRLSREWKRHVSPDPIAHRTYRAR